MSRSILAVVASLSVLGGCTRGPDAAPPPDSLPAVAAGATTTPEDAGPSDTGWVLIAGPTLLAVVPHTAGYLDSNVTDGSDLAIMLDDFSYYLGVTDSAIAARGIRRLLRIGPVVRWVQGARRDSMVLDADSGVAYLFWDPAGPGIHRGVMTDVDLLQFIGGTTDSLVP